METESNFAGSHLTDENLIGSARLSCALLFARKGVRACTSPKTGDGLGPESTLIGIQSLFSF